MINNANWEFTAESDPYGILDADPTTNPFWITARNIIVSDPDWGVLDLWKAVRQLDRLGLKPLGPLPRICIYD